jgi:hypothetical protein
MRGRRATPTRRHLLFAAAGLSGAALAAPRGSVPAHPRLDLSDPRVALEAYVKLRGSTVDATVWQPYGGDIFLAADGRLGIPLIGFWGLQKSHWRRAADHWRWIGARGTAVADLDPALVAAAERAWPGYVSRDAQWQVPTSGGLDYLRLRRGLAVTP